MSLPSASKLHIADACPASMVLPRVKDDRNSEAAETGTLVHKYVESVVGGYRAYRNAGREPDDALHAATEDALVDSGASDDVRKRCEALDFTKLPLEPDELMLEVGFVIDLTTGSVTCVGTGLKHGDLPKRVGSINAVVDYVARVGSRFYVLDWKSGHGDLPRPSHNPQLRAAMYAAAVHLKCTSGRVGIVRLWEDGKPRYDTEDVDMFDIDSALLWMRRLWHEERVQLERKATGQPLDYRPGKCCTYCESGTFCEALNREIVLMARQPTNIEARIEDALQAGDGAAAFEAYQRADAVLKRIKKAIYAHAAEHEIPLPDGRVLGRVQVARDTLDGDVAYETVRRLWGQGAADVSVKRKTSKKALRDAARIIVAARKAAGEKVTLAGTAERMLAEVSKAGGVVQKLSWRIEPHRPDEKLLTDGDDD